MADHLPAVPGHQVDLRAAGIPAALLPAAEEEAAAAIVSEKQKARIRAFL